MRSKNEKIFDVITQMLNMSFEYAKHHNIDDLLTARKMTDIAKSSQNTDMILAGLSSQATK